MKKGVLAASISALAILVGVSVTSTHVATASSKSIKITSKLPKKGIADNATIKGKAKGYKHIVYATSGEVQEQVKVKHGKWTLKYIGSQKGEKLGYIYGSKHQPLLESKFNKSAHAKAIKIKYSKSSIALGKSATSSSSSSSVSSFDTSKYVPVTKDFNLSTIASQSDDKLSNGVDYSLTHYYVTDIGADKMGQYHLLLSPTKGATPIFLIVYTPKKGQKFTSGNADSYVNAYGSLNGGGKVNSTQINTGISSEYLNKPVVLFMADKVEIAK